MLRVLPWVLPVCLIADGLAGEGALAVPGKTQESGPAFQTVLELETTARLLALLLVAGRTVINDNQDLFDDPGKGDKGFSPAVFERELAEAFRLRSGIDLRSLDSARLPQRAKKLLGTMVSVSKQVVADAQPQINQPGVGYKGFIPAVFGARVAGRFTETTGVKLKQTALIPRNQSNAPDPFEKAALLVFADPSQPRDKAISEVTAGSHVLRLMFPLYATRRCLDCHGEPRGQPDRTGHPREGLQLGQNAGAISVAIPILP
jgi:general secretion pathway protein A